MTDDASGICGTVAGFQKGERYGDSNCYRSDPPLRLTVSDGARSRAFYTEVLDFQHVTDLPSGVFLSNGAVGLGIGPTPDPSRAPANDRFDEARIGLDHLSFQVASRDELERARQLLDERGVPHGEVTDLGEAFGLYILAFRDPDNIQLELTAAYGA